LHLCLNFPALRYLRLERKAGPIIYGQGNLANMGARESAENGLGEIHRGKGLAIVTHGFMHQRAIEILDYFKNKDFDFGLIDTFCISPWNLEKNRSLLTQYDFFISLEEHFLPGGIGSSLLEALSDLGLNSKVLRLGICNQYFFENGGREYIHKLSGIDLMTCISKIEKFLKSNL